MAINFPSLPGVQTIRSGASIIKVVLFSLLAAFVVWFFLIRPDAAQQDAADAHMGAAQAEAQAQAAEETVRVIVDHQRTIETITTTTETASNDILNSPGAEAAIDPALHNAGIRALCLHDGRASEPACGSLLLPDDREHGPD